MKSLTAITTFVAFQAFAYSSEIFEFNRYIRPFLLNQHPIFITHGNKLSLPETDFQHMHSEEISSVLLYNFNIMHMDSTNLAQLTQMKQLLNVTGRHYNKFIWKRFPSFIHTFPTLPDQEVYFWQYRFLQNSGLGLRTRPRINSVIITHENSTIHRKKQTESFWNLNNKKLVESFVNYYDFAFHLKLEDQTKSLNGIIHLTSVSLLKFCDGCSSASEISFLQFENCEKSSSYRIPKDNFNCTSRIYQAISDTKLNLTKFGIQLEARDFRGRRTSGNCLFRTFFKYVIKFSSNFSNLHVQDVLLKELSTGLPVLHNCFSKEANKDLTVIKLILYPESSANALAYYDSQAFSSFQNQDGFSFLSCDSVSRNIDFMGYLEPFDAMTWIGTLVSLLFFSTTLAMLVYPKQNPSFILNTCFSSILTNSSLETRVANIPLLINNRLNTIRILMLSSSITTFILCSVYSSLVTRNVIAPKLITSPLTEYKQLEDKFTKVFGLDNQIQLSLVIEAKSNKSDPHERRRIATASKAASQWFTEVKVKLLKRYKFPVGECSEYHGNSTDCQAYRKELFGFVDSYSYVLRSSFKELKEKLAVCTKTAYIDSESSIDHFLHLWNEDSRSPPMVKGNSFFQKNYDWTIKQSWLLRKLMSSRLKAFTASGIIQFWESFCLKHCKSQTGHAKSHKSVMNSKTTKTFKSQDLGSNLTSLFFLMLILSSCSILCFLAEVTIEYSVGWEDNCVECRFVNEEELINTSLNQPRIFHQCWID
jgi:hypothetical protein